VRNSCDLPESQQRIGRPRSKRALTANVHFWSRTARIKSSAEREGLAALDVDAKLGIRLIFSAENGDVGKTDQPLADARGLGFHTGSPDLLALDTFKLVEPLSRVADT